MNEDLHINTVFKVYEHYNALDSETKVLYHKACEARNAAYAPYSKFYVGAAILLSNGEIVTGSNQENASYPSGLCAERTAMFYAGARFPEASVLKIVIVAGLQGEDNESPIPPCGACRQSLVEYELKQDHAIAIYFSGTQGKVIKSASVENLLPLTFSSSMLNSDGVK